MSFVCGKITKNACCLKPTVFGIVFFPKRARVIRDYLTAQITQWAAWGTRMDSKCLSSQDSPTPNGIQILLDVGAANLSRRAFRDVCCVSLTR